MHLFLAAIRCGRRGWILIGLLLVGALLASYDLINPSTGPKVHLVAIGADGKVQQVRTQATHPLDVLVSQQIPLAPHDLIRVDGQTYSPATLESRAWDNPIRTIFVLRSVMITILDRAIDGEQVHILYTTQTDVGRALDEAGIVLYGADRVTPGLSTPVEAGLVVRIDRSVPVTVIVDGRTLDTRAAGPTVGDALASLGIAPVDQDVTIPPEETPLEPAMMIQIVRVTEEIVIEYESIPFLTDYRFNPELAHGARINVQTGVEGLLERRIRVRYADGIETQHQIVSEYVIRGPVPCLVDYGEK